MKKVISFSLWGNIPKYTIGAIRNLEAQKKYFPDWICRFYIDTTSVPKEIIQELSNRGCEIVIKDVGNWKGMFWRFSVPSDKEVDIMICRDVDSRLCERDRVAVEEWLSSEKNFHIIRDHPHHNYRILGGLWGCRCNILRNIDILISNWNQEDRKQTDQEFLATIIYPLIQNDCFIHDEFNYYKEEKVYKINHNRINYEHLGGYINEHEQQSAWHCQELKGRIG
jgi:hypothetical protein